jgi:hypothetical protein
MSKDARRIVTSADPGEDDRAGRGRTTAVHPLFVVPAVGDAQANG